MLFYDSQPAASIDSHQRGFDGVGYEIILRTPLTIILHRIAPLAYKVSRTCLFIFQPTRGVIWIQSLALRLVQFFFKILKLLAGFDCGRDIKIYIDLFFTV